MAKLPCIPQARIFTLKETGETMSYDQVRQYLMSNPELWSGKGEQKAGPLSSVEATAKALEGIIENNPVEFTERPDGKVEIVGGVVKLQLAAQKSDKKNSITKPSKISFLPNKIVLAHLAKSKADKKGILKDGFDAKRVNIDSPIPGIYFSSEDWSTVGRFDRSKENSLFVEIENDGLLYFDSSSDFRNYLKENSLPYQGETLSKEQLDFLKQKGVKGVVLREDFASQSKNELIVIDDSIIKDISESEKPITKLPSSFSEPQSISEAYHAAKKDGTNPELVKAVENLLGGEQKAEAANTPKDIASRIRNKKQKGALSAIDFGISVTIYNGALEFMANQVEKGTKLGNAIANTIKWVDDKMKGEKWNKGAFGKYMNDTYKVTLGDGREVEVVRDDSKETAEVINGWYQPIEQKVLDSKEESLPANKWAERLKSKEDEDLFTGVRAFLEEKGTERVSRQELLNFIKDNRIEIVTVVKGEGGLEKDWRPSRELVLKKDGTKPTTGRKWTNAGWKVVENTDSDYSIFYPDGSQLEGSWGSKDGAFDRVRMMAPEGTTKFSQYQLPGDKENYKEVLVTLPSRVSGFKKKTYERAMDLVRAIRYKELPDAQLKEIIRNEYGITEDIVKRVRESDNSPAELNDALSTIKAAEKEQLTELSSKDFNSSHFDEPNILVHLRMNTRTDADGNKVLFLEEVQSDWGQEGKKKGFADKFTALDHWGNVLGVFDSEADAQEAVNRTNTRRQEGVVRKSTTGLPTAPFIMDTNAWVKLGLKTALKEAVAQGADKIAWTTGEQQNDRYDLSKQVDGIAYFKNKNGTFDLIAERGDEFEKSFDNVEPKDLEGIVGKDVAQKIIENVGDEEYRSGLPHRVLRGENLKVGGKGMKGFYGSVQEGSKGIIGGVAEKLFGQKVGETKVDVKNKDERQYDYKYDGGGEWIVIDRGNNDKIVQRFFNEKAAIKFMNEKIKAQKAKSKPNTQSSISITPELKAQVEKGLPLFGTEQQDAVVKFLRAQRADPNILGLNAGLWNGLLTVIEKAWLASKSASKAIQAGIKWLKEQKEDPKEWEKYLGPVRERMQKLEAELKEEKPAAAAPKKKEAPEGKKPVRELPEAPEGQVAKAVLGRNYQATTSEKVAEAMEKSGLFREVRNLDEAFKAGRKFVDELGWDGAYELFQDLTATVDGGILLPEDNRMGIFNALTEDLQKRIDNPVSLEQQSKDAILMAEVMAKGSELVSRGAYRMRVFQEILRRNTVPYQYEKRIKEWKALFPDSEITKEIEDKLKAAEAKYILINQKYMDLIAKQKEQEESEAVSDIKQDIESEKKAAKKPITSALKTLAAKVRKLGISRPGMFSAATPASLAWDAAVEVVAVTLEAGGSIEIAIKKGLQSIVDSKWYKGLSDKDKKRAESEFVNHHADLEEAGAGMAEVVKGNISIPHSLIRYYVSEGMTDIDQIADAILEGLSEEYPDLTQREVRDAITGYGRKVKKRTSDQINDDILTLKSEGRLRSQLEDLQQGIKKEKDPKRKKELSELAKNLMKEIDKIHQDMFGHTTKQMSDAERLEAYKKRAAERIKELRRKIDQKDFAKKEKRPPVDFDKEASDLELEQYLLDEEWADMVREQQLKNQGTLTKIGDLLLNVWGIPRSVVVGIDYGVFAIQAGLSTFNSRKQTAKAFASAFKAMKSVSNYQRVDAALKANPKYLDAKKAGLKFYSPKDPDIMKGDMISVSALQRAWNAIGEGFLKLVSPVIGSGKEKQWYDTWKKINPIAGLERSQSAFINTLNFGLYLRGAEIARERGYVFNKANEQIFKDIADVTNTLSRKAALGGLENNKKFMTVMSASFFSAQNWAALLKLASPYTFVWLGSKRAGTTKWNQLSPAQQVYGEIFVKAVGTYLSTLLLVKLLTGWEDDDMDDEERKKKGVITVNMTDPRRSDYLKVRLPEGTIDPFSGLAQEVILSYRIWKEIIGERGFVSSKTGIETYLGEGTTPSWAGLIGRQAEGKLSPSARYLWRRGMSKQIKGQPDYIRKMILTGEEINMKEEAIDLFTNLTYQTALDQYKDYNVLPATFLSLLAFAGYGFTREERAEDKAISKQIKETLGPEKKYLAYEKAFKDYLKEGDEELAKKVFKNAVKGGEESKKSIEIFKELGGDNVPQKYNLDSKDFDELLSVAKTGRPIDASGMSDVKAKRMSEINSLNKEALDRIKSDYGVQYDELQSAAKVLKSLNIKNSEGEPIDWDYKMSRIPWVKKYRRIVLGTE